MKEKIVRYSKEDLKKLKGKTDHDRVSRTTDEEIEEQVKNDPDSYLPTDEELKLFKKVNKDGSHE
ncbi:hypothetical protein [Oceanobacter kriegii]|uniref:hypothetical protein n=1 Tax=Oceanobacter kriegii TaxID=64972 RepID=UPI00055CFFD4|nr:hypothetical protein [Oceanobacter kriegii]